MTTVNLTDFKYFSVYIGMSKEFHNSDRVREMKLKFYCPGNSNGFKTKNLILFYFVTSLV